jgi:hypothetical protein
MIRNSVIRAALVLALSPWLAGCGIDSLIDKFTGPGRSDVEYRVSGTASRVSLRYETEDGTAENGNSSVPWSFTRKAEKDDLLYVSAQIIEGDGTVTASIYKGKDLIMSSTSTGPGAIATASGTLE